MTAQFLFDLKIILKMYVITLLTVKVSSILLKINYMDWLFNPSKNLKKKQRIE